MSEEFQRLTAAYQSRNDKEFSKQIFRHKLREGGKVWKLKRHSQTARNGYQELTSPSQRHVRFMSVIVALVFGCLAGTYLFFYTDVPALTALIIAPLVTIAVWYVPQYLMQEEESLDSM